MKHVFSMTLGTVLPVLLAKLGVDTIFGIPGVHTIELYRAMGDSGLRHVTGRHEQGLGFMADGYARRTGRPGVCLVITGPGLTNIATAMAQAYGDSVPLLVISSVNATSQLGRGEGRLHELPNQQALASGLAAFSHRLTRADELPAVLERAFALFATARPRPVHIEIPTDLMAAPLAIPTGWPSMPSQHAAPNPTEIAAAARLLTNAERPLVVLGGGAVKASDAARSLVERLGAPVVLTINGKGILAASDPLNVGSLLPEPAILNSLTKADVVLAIGTELGETDTLLFGGALDLEGKVIRIDIDRAQLDRNVKAAIGIVGDAGRAMRALEEALMSLEHVSPPAGRAAALRELAMESVRPIYRSHGELFARLAAENSGLVIVGDSTQPIYGANLTFRAEGPGRYFNSSTGYGTLGYALSAAIGAWLADRRHPVLSVIGDGGLQFTIGEMATAAELNADVVMLVWNNSRYGEIKTAMLDAEIAPVGVDVLGPDLEKLASAFGWHYALARSESEIVQRVRQGFAAKGPHLVEVDEASMLAEWGFQ